MAAAVLNGGGRGQERERGREKESEPQIWLALEALTIGIKKRGHHALGTV